MVSSLRLYFFILAVFAAIQVCALLRPGTFTGLGVAIGGADLFLLTAYLHIAVRFKKLLVERLGYIKGVVAVQAVISVLAFLATAILGIQVGSLLGVVISILVYVYLRKSVDRLSAEAKAGTPPVVTAQ